jgi:dimethylargininase
MPCRRMVKGLSNAGLGIPYYNLALQQHQKYIEALVECGVEVTSIAADENYPDSVFIEDAALLTPVCAVITNPGAPSRKGEIVAVERSLSQFYLEIERINAPGSLDAGDIMKVGNHYYIGISQRTNHHGANQMIAILKKHGMTGSIIPLKKVLHLKSGVSYLENNTMVISGEFLYKKEFSRFITIQVDPSESYAANCIWVNGTVIIAEGYPKFKEAVTANGYPTIELDMSEFRKLDGGLSCLSLRF